MKRGCTLDDTVRSAIEFIMSIAPGTVDDIKKEVADYFDLDTIALSGKGRTRTVSLARHLAMALSRQLTILSLSEIGLAFGRDHTTVLHACRKFSGYLGENG